MTLTYFALVASFLALALGCITLLGEAGYRFDLRRGARRKAVDGRAGGRRDQDRLPAASK